MQPHEVAESGEVAIRLAEHGDDFISLLGLQLDHRVDHIGGCHVHGVAIEKKACCASEKEASLWTLTADLVGCDGV